MLSDMISKNVWTRIKREHGLYRYNPTGQYFARVRFGGKLYRRKLDTDDLALAKRKLRDFKNTLERTDANKGNMSLAAMLDIYDETLGGAAKTKKDKRAIFAKLKQTWFGIDALPLRTIIPSSVKTWLSRHYGDQSASYYNAALTVLRAVFDLAVNDKIITESPADGLKYRKRQQAIKLTPSFEQFKEIVASIRAQTFNREAEESGDFIEFMGLAGLGQAEVSGIIRAHVRLDKGEIDIYRHKTTCAFTIPIYPQLRALVEKLCAGKKHEEHLFKIKTARKALTNACKRLELPIFIQRSLRRMFVTRAIERGIDVKVIAKWQGHKDGGKLILSTYSHVRPAHEDRMAALMTEQEPANVIAMPKAEAN